MLFVSGLCLSITWDAFLINLPWVEVEISVVKNSIISKNVNCLQSPALSNFQVFTNNFVRYLNIARIVYTLNGVGDSTNKDPSRKWDAKAPFLLKVHFDGVLGSILWYYLTFCPSRFIILKLLRSYTICYAQFLSATEFLFTVLKMGWMLHNYIYLVGRCTWNYSVCGMVINTLLEITR